MEDQIAQLTLMMADLWIRHMATQESNEEISEELEQICNLRGQLGRLVNQKMVEQQSIETIPQKIIQFLQENDADCFPVQITRFNEKPLQYLIQSNKPIYEYTMAGLDLLFPDMIVLETKPRTNPNITANEREVNS